MRSRFDQQLEALNAELTEMGTMIETAISNSVKALMVQDEQLARQAASYDDEINRKEADIESLCMKLLLQQQPVARDLRIISSALKMITDMERIGDQACDIAEITIEIIGNPYVKEIEHIPIMARETIKMVNDCIEAFVNKDVDLAVKVIDQDDVVDKLFDQIKSELTDIIRENNAFSSGAIDLIMIAKYFERIGDHATNIAEWVVYSITGKHKTLA